METAQENPGTEPVGWIPGMSDGTTTDAEMQRLAETFAVTPQAVRLAMARVGGDFRDLQRELGGRR